MTRLLVIDDDHDLAAGIAVTLRRAAYEATVAQGLNEGLERGLAYPSPDLIILDLALSEVTDFQLLRSLREGMYLGPILATSTSVDEADKVQAFLLGADQYLTKPFGEQELLARVNSLLARAGRGIRASSPAQASKIGEGYFFGNVVVQPATREVHRRGKPVKLSPLEFELLVALLRRQGAATTRGELLREVWKYDPDVVSRTLDTHILNLRGKLEDEPSTPRHILTVRKLGYRLHC